tara:strand:+ start:3607 stop:4161 length:555 start_codon:yes stop_codon:yes gene_type:complete
MIEFAAAAIGFIFCVVVMMGYREEKKKIEAYCDSKGWSLSENAEADFYAAQTYEETGEAAAFMLFDHEEPEDNASVSTPVPPQRSRPEVKTPKPRRKPKPVTNNDSKRIKDLERQLAKLQRLVNSQQQKPVKNTTKVHPLHQDCVDALVSVGYNKTEAKKIVKNVLTDSITNVQDFLTIAMRKA